MNNYNFLCIFLKISKRISLEGVTRISENFAFIPQLGQTLIMQNLIKNNALKFLPKIHKFKPFSLFTI